MSASAKGLFRATGRVTKPVMVDLVDGEAVYAETLEREKDDFYPTPPEPMRAFLHAEMSRLRDFPVIWECAAGDGAMMREMDAAGLCAVGSDKVFRGNGAVVIKDFYEFKTPPARAILTNPPFGECNNGAWIRHALEVLAVDYMALLLPLNWVGAITRAALWSEHPPARVHVMRWRIDWTGQGANPSVNAWFVWDNAATDPTQLLMLDRRDVRQSEMFPMENATAEGRKGDCPSRTVSRPAGAPGGAAAETAREAKS